MNVAVLLNQRDAELFLARYPKVRVNIIASGVDTFVYLRHHHIPYQRLTRYFDLRKTKTEWGTARRISDRFLRQPLVASLYQKDVNYRYPIHQHLKYLLTDIVRNQAIAKRILNKNKPEIIIKNSLSSITFLSNSANKRIFRFA
ncbi:MAG: hypothetical protein UX17_C0034G0007 [Parcubacteria group bacterium GW2011_GWC2_45_7]|nr:MAG: hypothetical protein UX17_C0034G0007 [Parcubacteria group bacterium GW2011_GWC2_45_7]